MVVERLPREDTHMGPAYLVKVPNRSKDLLLEIPEVSGYGLWEVKYADGKPIPSFDGKFTSHKFALKAIDEWCQNEPPTEKAKHEMLFGDKEPPVLKTKKVKKVATETESNDPSDVQ